MFVMQIIASGVAARHLDTSGHMPWSSTKLSSISWFKWQWQSGLSMFRDLVCTYCMV